MYVCSTSSYKYLVVSTYVVHNRIHMKLTSMEVRTFNKLYSYSITRCMLGTYSCTVVHIIETSFLCIRYSCLTPSWWYVCVCMSIRYYPDCSCRVCVYTPLPPTSPLLPPPSSSFPPYPPPPPSSRKRKHTQSWDLYLTQVIYVRRIMSWVIGEHVTIRVFQVLCICVLVTLIVYYT
jgi:hypothetical protein